MEEFHAPPDFPYGFREEANLISRAAFDFVRETVAARAGFAFTPGTEFLVESRLLGLARDRRISSVTELIRMMQADSVPGADQLLVEALADGETCFFRDVKPFDALRRQIIPELKAKRAPEQKLMIWSIGCSTGQEPYSLALMLREYFPELLTWSLEIMASDISLEALRIAEAGRYNQIEINRGLPTSMLVKHFQKEDVRWRLKDEVCGMVQFFQMNVLGQWPVTESFDVIFFRNVLPGLSPDLQAGILGRVLRRLKPDGSLFIGGKENAKCLPDYFEEVRVDKLVYYRPKPGALETLQADEAAEAQAASEVSPHAWARLLQFSLRKDHEGAADLAKMVEADEPLAKRLIQAASKDQATPGTSPLKIEEVLTAGRKEVLSAVALGSLLAPTLSEAFATMLPDPIEGIDPPAETGEEPDCMSASVKFSGQANGLLAARMKPELATELAAQAMGIDPLDAGPDVVKSFLEQLMGMLLTTLKPKLASARFEWSLEAVTVAQLEKGRLALPPKTARETLAFQYQGQTMLFDVAVNSIVQRIK